MLACLLVACGATAARGPVDPETRAAYASLVVPADRCGAPPAAEVTPEQMRADWAVIERVLRRGYAGFERAGDEARWARAFAEARAAIPDEPVEALAFRDAIVEALRFADDNHLSFTVRGARGRSWRATGEHRQAYVGDLALPFGDGAPRASDVCVGATSDTQLYPVIGPDGTLARRPVVLATSPPPPLPCRSATGEEQRITFHAIEIGDADGPAFEQRRAPFPWLRLRTLVASRRDVLERFVESADAARDAPVVVLDLRDIGGGADRYLNDWFERYSDQDLQYWRTRRVVSEVALAGALTFWGCIARASSGDAGGRAWVEARVARARRELDEAMHERGLFREMLDGEHVLRGRAATPPRGRLVLLVNRRCASACETSVMLARQLAGAVVVGENTEGTMKVGEIRSYRLPESGIWMTAGTRIHDDPRGVPFPESTGYVPDLFLDADVENRLPALVGCLGDPACAALVDRAIATERDRD